VGGREGGCRLALRYDANEHLKPFHALIVARVNVLGVGSGTMDRYFQNPSRLSYKPHQVFKIKKLYNPHVLSDFRPHFTLLLPYTGKDYEGIRRVMTSAFAQFSEIPGESFCLLLQMDRDKDWVIHRESVRSS
jgi:hypothetical protein